jgi:ergothioneine biosynthesis protein EgtC
MCRFTFYSGQPITLGSLVTEPAHSLIHQSFESREREEPLNGDGFGIAWYTPEVSNEPARFRSITPAWNNQNLLDLARVVKSSCILAHVRAATQYIAVTETNCHPFKHGRWAFMHNGDIGGFPRVRRPMLSHLSDASFGIIGGTTDSEHFFALVLDELRREDDPFDVVAMGTAMTRAIQKTCELVTKHAPGEYIYLNAVFSDGERSVAVRFTTDEPQHASSLYLNEGHRYVCEDGVCWMVEPEDEAGTVIVSSEPLSSEASWRSIAPNSMVLIEHGRVHSKHELLV